MGIQFLKMNTIAKCFLATLLACFLLSVIAAPGSTPSADNEGLIPNDSSDDSIYLQYPDDEYYDDEYYNDYYPDNVGPGRRKRSTDNDRCSGEWKTYECDGGSNISQSNKIIKVMCNNQMIDEVQCPCDGMSFQQDGSTIEVKCSRPVKFEPCFPFCNQTRNKGYSSAQTKTKTKTENPGKFAACMHQLHPFCG